ncbi:hypothetical protein LZ198_14230 [Myxococcus sp. K15C18031901]|uniref:hypothetical protein n=1 Tax=Myxococcus dinghuensis TaxID=2906761 RepID=UPI0020A78D69|nr:hypothetical protein [Myxococcus dinghuensis]MCP3100030.1 hypothetical protein [Myxococcus dinghuensis]
MRSRVFVPCFLLFPAAALAGMPSVRLSDIASQRVEAISFFVGVFALVALAVRVLWNRLRKDFPRLPLLTFRSAAALVFLLSLGFHLVLSMIAGGRELMTPGAWERSGVTYQLTSSLPPSDSDLVGQARRQRLEELRVALWAHAAAHGGAFPASDLGPELPVERWTVVGDSGMHFIYRGGLKADEGATPLAYEPGIFGRERWVLFTNGEVRRAPLETIHASIEQGGAP